MSETSTVTVSQLASSNGAGTVQTQATGSASAAPAVDASVKHEGLPENPLGGMSRDDLLSLIEKQKELLMLKEGIISLDHDDQKRLSSKVCELEKRLDAEKIRADRLQSEVDKLNKTNAGMLLAEQSRLVRIAQASQREAADRQAENNKLQATLNEKQKEIEALQRKVRRAKPSKTYVDQACQATSIVNILELNQAPRIARNLVSIAVQAGDSNEPPRPQPLAPAKRTNKKAPVSVDIPEARIAALQNRPIITDVLANEQPVYFNRTELSIMLGGQRQALVTKVSTATQLSTQHAVTQLLYPKRDLNCWLPKSPGTHGYMFVGLKGPGKDHLRFMEPSVHTLFITGEDGLEYFGEYEAVRIPNLDLAVAEWNSFPLEFRYEYAACTFIKSDLTEVQKKWSKSTPQFKQAVQKTMDAYDAGKLRVPCTALRCVDYNKSLVTDLLAAKGTGPSTGVKLGKRPSDTPQSKGPRKKKAKTAATPDTRRLSAGTIVIPPKSPASLALRPPAAGISYREASVSAAEEDGSSSSSSYSSSESDDD
ncbi:hypothetical protein K474DRAFT_1704798 [Panus rudis PR-1116 ss-1]|nr:hypothetical protein K474DRAFT_1704798 [Panus rudis PR-1116 ss-1]